MHTVHIAPWRAPVRLASRLWAGSRLGVALALPVAVSLFASLLAVGAVGARAAVPAHGRAWELVTPPSVPPDGNSKAPVESLAVDGAGDRIVYATNGPTSDASAGAVLQPNIAVRGQGGWTAKSVTYPYSVPAFALMFPFPFGASEDLSTWIWNSYSPLLPGAPDGFAPGGDTGWYRGTTDGGLTLLGHGGDFDSMVVMGVSDDAQRLVFQTSSSLLPADADRTGSGQVYEYVGSTLELVGVDSGGALLSTCGAAGSASLPPNPVSRDGRRVFFASRVPDCGATERVYLREGEATTTEISVSRCSRVDCDAAADVRFMGATPDGSVAFLASTQQLTDDDVDESEDLYRYDLADDSLSRVSVGASGVGADVVATRAYSSDDGSRAYFLANGSLVAGEGVVGSPNVYVADGGGVHFVATLGSADDWPAGATSNSALQEVAVTPDGERIMFVTAAALTADDSDASRDVYLYDADADSLTRASGTPGSGNGAFDVQASLARNFLSRPPFPGRSPKALSADGRHLFFVTSEPLLAQDVNDDADVYEWFDGDLGLVSSGHAFERTLYLGESADGSTAFFSTEARLVAADTDDDYDLYAARVGGGFPDPPPPPPAECGGGECPSPPVERLDRPDPGSLTFVERRRGRLKIRRPGASALRQMADGGRLSLVVAVPRAGLVSGRASARIGGRVRTVAKGRVRAARAGRVRLGLRLSRLARRRLADGGSLSVRVVVRLARLERAGVVRFRLVGVK